MKTLMVDMDDVITLGRFTDYIESFLNKKVDFAEYKGYFRQELIAGKEKAFSQQYENKNLYEDAPLLTDCYEVLARLNKKYDIYIVTAYIWNKDLFNPVTNLKNKFNYLQKELPFIDSHKYIFAHNKNIMHFDIKIDDCLTNLANAKIKLLFNSWHNAEIPENDLKEQNVIRVDNWLDIETVLNKLDNEDESIVQKKKGK